MITIDPGVHGSGIAWWSNGHLVQISYHTVLPPQVDYHNIVIEIPQVYLGSKSKGNPNDLIRLAYAAGCLVGDRLGVETVWPRQWKGTIKKEAMLRRILSKLTPFELGMLQGLGLPPSKEHNVTDAVGIGLWKLGRL